MQSDNNLLQILHAENGRSLMCMFVYRYCSNLFHCAILYIRNNAAENIINRLIRLRLCK